MPEAFDISKPVTFRLPQSTAPVLLEFLDELKKNEGRKFGSECASMFLAGVQERLAKGEGERVTISLPGQLTSEQREWLNNPLTKQMLGQWVYSVISQPDRPAVIGGVAPCPVEAAKPPLLQNKATQNLARALLSDDDED